MKKLNKVICLLSLAIALTSCSNNEIKCVLRGEVFNIEYDTLALMKATDDFQWGEKILIPVVDGRFEYKLHTDAQEVYSLFFLKQLESWAITTYEFISLNDTIRFKLYPGNEFDKTEIIGGEANKEPLRMHDLYQEIFASASDSIWGKMDELRKQNLTDTEDYSILKQELDALNTRSTEWILEYCSESLSIFSYYYLINIIKSLEHQKGLDIEKVKVVTQIFHDQYPDHPYTELSSAMLKAREKIQIGRKYIDFALPDLEGNIHKLSEVIGGKYAVIDLWASWCGPCIMGSRELLPIYDEFKGIGFTICGVAREFRNTNAMASRIEQEKYPWINLVELDDQNDIWLTYGAQGGGRKFFVDDTGIILAIEPTAAEIREILNARLAMH